jgi:hypothetical protein
VTWQHILIGWPIASVLAAVAWSRMWRNLNMGDE